MLVSNRNPLSDPHAHPASTDSATESHRTVAVLSELLDNQSSCATCTKMHAGKPRTFSTVVCANCLIVTTRSSCNSSMFLPIEFARWEGPGNYLRANIFKILASPAR